MDKLFSVLYLEDDINDARIVAKLIQELLKEYGEKPQNSFGSVQEVYDYLFEKGFEWTRSFEEFQKNLDQNAIKDYKVFLIDMKMENESGVRGWEIIEKIREKRSNQASPIWILSQYSFFARPAKREYSIQHFFHKDQQGYVELKEILTEVFLPIKPKDYEEYLEFEDGKNTIVRIPVNRVVSIEIVNRHHFLYELDKKGFAAHKKAFPPHKIFDLAKEQIRKKEIHDLVQISHGVIVNIKLVERIEGSGKRYFLYLSQRGDNKPLSVSYQYLGKLKEIYGDPLPVS